MAKIAYNVVTSDWHRREQRVNKQMMVSNAGNGYQRKTPAGTARAVSFYIFSTLCPHPHPPLPPQPPLHHRGGRPGPLTGEPTGNLLGTEHLGRIPQWTVEPPRLSLCWVCQRAWCLSHHGGRAPQSLKLPLIARRRSLHLPYSGHSGSSRTSEKAHFGQPQVLIQSVFVFLPPSPSEFPFASIFDIPVRNIGPSRTNKRTVHI